MHPPRASRATLIALATLLSFAACGCRAPGPATQPATSQPAPGPAATQPGDPQLATDTLLPAPPDYATSRIGTPPYAIPPYAKFLKGLRIVLDPGHGGDAHKRGFKRGPTGVREAEMNLRVAEYLRDFLVAVGANVRLTRSGDTDLELAARAAIANDWPADMFLSIHHNAVNKPAVNYTTVWYHGTVDTFPANLDLARHVSVALHDVMHFPTVMTFPLKSDQLMYPDGFGVLRAARVPAALSESSFYTHPEEEQRLRDPAYNLREAYALFLALARHAHAGLPRVALAAPADGVLQRAGGGSAPALAFTLDDGLRKRGGWGADRAMILRDSLQVRLLAAADAAWIDGRPLAWHLRDDYGLEVTWPADAAPGRHWVDVRFTNMNKQSAITRPVPVDYRTPAPQ